MADEQSLPTGRIAWCDLTISNADEIRDFYADVIGWSPTPVEMGDYSDYAMVPADTEDAVAGICHERGPNKGLPAQWLIYITVPDLDDSIRRCTERGGKVISGPKSMGGASRYCVIRDPAGAVAALYQAETSDESSDT